MRFQRLLIMGSASLLSLFLFLILLLAVLAYSHDRWLPPFINQYLLSEPVAGLPANSLHLDAIELESWERLHQLTLSGPNNSQLQIQGVNWPSSGDLIIERLTIRLPDQLPELLPATQTSDDSEVKVPDPVAPVEDVAKPSVPGEPPQTAAELLLSQELSFQKAYGEYLNQIDHLFAQLESFRKQYQLQTMTIRSLDLHGVPLKHTVSAKYFSGDPGYKNGQPYWQLSFSSRNESDRRDANLDFRLRLSPQDHQLSLTLKQLDQLSPDAFKLPVWIPLKRSFEELRSQVDQYGLKPIDYDARLVLQMQAQKADIAISLPTFDLRAVDSGVTEACKLTFEPRTLSLGYHIADTGSEQMRFNPGKELIQDLSGNCVTALFNLPQDSGLHHWLKGLDKDALRQGGRLSLKLKDVIRADLISKAMDLSGLELGWQPKASNSIAFQLLLPQIKLTPEKLAFGIESKLKAELKPQPLFANQSRQFSLNLGMNADIGLELASVFTPKPDQDIALSWLQNVRLDISNSEFTLLPAPNDDAVLWAPSRLEIPLFQHGGRWTIGLQQPFTQSGHWQFAHQGQGEAFVRYPGLKRNARVPYQADLELAGRLSDLSVDTIINTAAGHFNWKLIDASARTATLASSPISLLPELSVNTRIVDDEVLNEFAVEVELARVPEWLALPAGTRITDGRISLQADTQLAKNALIVQASSPDQLLGKLVSSVVLNLSKLTGEAKSYEFSNVDLPLNLKLADGDIDLQPTTLNIDRVFAGVELTGLKADLNASGNLIEGKDSLSGSMSDFSASTLGGRIWMAEMMYPFPSDQASDLILDKLDLSQLIALGEKQIKVTGLLNGKLPVLLSDKGVAIRNGQVKSEAGEIILKDNPAWQAMLQQQPVLASQLKHLNQLHYDLLQGDVEMEESGQLTAVLKIRGENREESQPVNLNFTSEQNILTLLKALRLSDQIDKSLSESAQRTYQ